MVSHVNGGRHGGVVLVVDVVPRAGNGVAQHARLINPRLQVKSKTKTISLKTIFAVFLNTNKPNIVSAV